MCTNRLQVRLATFGLAALSWACSAAGQTALRPLSGQGDQSFGHCLAAVPDLSGDGLPDILVGVPQQRVDRAWDAGRVYVYGGGSGRRLHVLESPDRDDFGRFGEAVAGLGDIDGDGLGDILIGAPGEGPGRVYVFSGGDGSLVRRLYPPVDEYVIGFGSAVSGLGDVDGDGRADFAASCLDFQIWDGTTSHAHVWIFSGRTGEVLRELRPPTQQPFSGFGEAMAGLRDVDGDGRPDVVVGAKSLDTDAGENAGGACVYSGATGRLLHTLRSPSHRANGQFGAAVADAGDLNGDCLSEILVGAPGEGPGEGRDKRGRVHVFGPRGRVLATLRSPGDKAPSGFGASVAGLPDVDGDGVPDIAVGAPGETTRYVRNGGRVHVFSGATFARVRTIVSPGKRSSKSFGAAVVGLAEGRLAVGDGLTFLDPDGSAGAGTAYLFKY